MSENKMESPYMTEREAAAYLKYSVATLRVYRCLRKGPAYTKLGNARSSRVLYTRADLDAYVTDVGVKTDPQASKEPVA